MLPWQPSFDWALFFQEKGKFHFKWNKVPFLVVLIIFVQFWRFPRVTGKFRNPRSPPFGNYDEVSKWPYLWTKYVTEVVKKASKRLYFLIQLNTARVPRHDLVLILYFKCKVCNRLCCSCCLQCPSTLLKERAATPREKGLVHNNFRGREVPQQLGIRPMLDHYAFLCQKLFNTTT